jgi:dTDP-4-amino-4,6-dideoxygalactose transaminase
MGGRERDLLNEAFDSNWIAPLGPFVDRFEAEVCRLIGVPHAAALSSGTAALHLALIGLDIGKDDRVICSTLTFAASSNPIRYLGAEPVFIDSEMESWNMDPELLREELRTSAAQGRLPKAVIVVDLYGQCADYATILPLCAEYGVPVIEDAAEALCATCGGQSAGSFGEMAVLSFNGNKIITTSGGGMLIARDEGKVSRARFLATQARDAAAHYQHSAIGYNYRMSNLLAAVGVGQLSYLSERVAARRSIFENYRSALGDLPGISFMPEAEWGVSNRWLTCILVDPLEFGASREELRIALEAANIEARPLWKPMHMQPVFDGCRVRGGAVSEWLFERGLCLPSGSGMSGEEFVRVVDVIRSVHRRSVVSSR